MGSLYRSEDMVLCQMYLQSDVAYSCVAQLGELGIVQFRDLNADVNSFQRHFVTEIRRCEEMERQLRFFEREMTKHGVTAESVFDIGPPVQRDMVDIEASFDSMEADLKDLTNSVESLEKNYLELEELLYVLEFTNPYFEHGEPTTPHDVELQDPFGIVDLSAGSRTNLQYLSGVIPTERFNGFNRLLWFATHGNVLVRSSQLLNPVKDRFTQEMTRKTVFVVMFQGDQLLAKVRKISEGFKANIYPCPDKIEERREMMLNLRNRMADLDVVLNKSREQQERMLHFIARSYSSWAIKVRKLKAIYIVMNMFHNEGQNFVAECWMPYNELGSAQAVLNRASETAGSQVSSLLHPVVAKTLPTYHRVNKFTRAFQVIIDAYGVASYKEVNPAAFSIITFPFLFSVMFGDAGHGLLMLLFAIFLIARERHLVAAAKDSEMFGIIFGGRYLILLMGLFSIYAGFIYNDIFSKSVQIFGSGWHGTCIPEHSTDSIHDSKDWQLNPSNASCYRPNQPYVFGVDPVWQLSVNKIMFTNSFKKKISVIFGVSQMLLGVLLSICNHIYFRRFLNIFCEFIPQLLFLLSIFGYLCGLIFTKWALPTDYQPPYAANLTTYNYYQCSPNILIGFINMFLMKYDTAENVHCSNVAWFPGQQPLQVLLVILAVICAIWMLLSKPLTLKFIHRKKNPHAALVDGARPDNSQQIDADMDQQLLSDSSTADISEDQLMTQENQSLTMPQAEEEEFDFGEIFIHQSIHTIEFCLGCISHTASYLRLWALSLAHAQLSEVLWTMVMRIPFTYGFSIPVGALVTFLVFAPFATLTVVILLIMEGLSAFLHTLRLHWVEFNSKFYKGEGVAFEPFSFAEILENE